MVTYQALHIPNPCTKIHYDDLPYDPNKRPCHVCQKPVYDFRDKDQAFLNKVWKAHQGDFCGTFRHHQFSEGEKIQAPLTFTQKTKAQLVGLYLSFLTLLAHTSQAQNQVSNAHPIEQGIVEPSDSNHLKLHAKECESCIKEFSVVLFINGLEYGKYLITSDTLEIKLPPSLRPKDQIKISGSFTKTNRGWNTFIRKRREKVFEFGSRSEVEVEMIRKKRVRLIYKRDFIGCPKFR